MTTGPASLRWTHLALPTRDLDAAVAWYTGWTPLEVVHQRRDPDGRTAWLGHRVGPDEHPFVLVLIEPAAGIEGIEVTLGPLAHLGFELPERAGLEEIAGRADAAGSLVWPVRDLGPPVGTICAVRDPDGNVVEFSHGQGVYDAARQPRASSDSS